MKYEYMKESEQMLQLLPVSEVFAQTAQFPKLQNFLYMILYDRARISRMNERANPPSYAGANSVVVTL